jgi:hypothetical protein
MVVDLRRLSARVNRDLPLTVDVPISDWQADELILADASRSGAGVVPSSHLLSRLTIGSRVDRLPRTITWPERPIYELSFMMIVVPRFASHFELEQRVPCVRVIMHTRDAQGTLKGHRPREEDRGRVAHQSVLAMASRPAARRFRFGASADTIEVEPCLEGGRHTGTPSMGPLPGWSSVIVGTPLSLVAAEKNLSSTRR